MREFGRSQIIPTKTLTEELQKPADCRDNAVSRLSCLVNWWECGNPIHNFGSVPLPFGSAGKAAGKQALVKD